MIERIEALERVLEHRNREMEASKASACARIEIPILWKNTLSVLGEFDSWPAKNDIKRNGWSGVTINVPINYKDQEINLNITHCARQKKGKAHEEYMAFTLDQQEIVSIRLFTDSVGHEEFVIDDEIRRGRGLPPVDPKDIIDMAAIIPTLGKRA